MKVGESMKRTHECVCEYCNEKFMGVRPGQRFCSQKHNYLAREKRNERTHAKVPPMPRDQAVVNAFLMGRSMTDVNSLIDDVFQRPVK